MRKIDIVTIFPEQIENFIKFGIFRIAESKGLAQVEVHDMRKWTTDPHRTVDDRPFGGGAGMVLMVEPIYKAVNELKREGSVVVATTPRGTVLKQRLLREMAGEQKYEHLIFLCGHYEGFDQRILDNLVDLEICVGDYILSGGELPVLTICDGILRLIPGVLGNEESPLEESFEDGILEYPHYTRPQNFNGWEVPDILLSGDHKSIAAWRQKMGEIATQERRPDIAKK